MKTTLSEPSTTERVLEIEVERERLDRIFDEKVKKYRKEVRIKGFRPGNVPKDVIVSRFKGPIHAESLEALVEEAVREACKENGVQPIAPGKIDELVNEPEQPIRIKAVLEVDPPLEVKDYRVDIPVKAEPISDEQVESHILEYQRRLAKEEKLERPAQMGDVVVAEYLEFLLEGEAQTLPERKEFRVELGSGPLTDLHAGLVGVQVGDVRDVNVQFPQEYPQAAFAGRKGQYKLKILEVSELKLPAADDEFAKSFSRFETIDALRAQIRKDLEEAATHRAKSALYDDAMRQVIERNPFEVPRARLNQYIHYRLHRNQEGREGEEEHHHHHDESGDEVSNHPEMVEEAKFQLRRHRILAEVARKENVKATQEEVDARVHELAMQYGVDFEGLKASLRKNGRINDIREDIRMEKTLDYIIGWQPSEVAA